MISSFPTMNRLIAVTVAAIATWVCLASTSAEAQTQKRLFGYPGTTVGNLGMAVAGVGDMNGDGYDDFAAEDLNTVIVYSGRTGTPIRKFAMPGVDGVWAALAGGGDVNRDGVPDLIVGDWDSGTQQRGMVWVISGSWIAKGTPPKMIHTLDAGVLGFQRFGYRVEDGGDLDGDGWDDVLVASRDNASNYLGVAFSGRTGKELWRNANMSVVRHAGDVNRDGKDDVIGFDYRGSTATVYSGLDGRSLLTIAGPRFDSADGLGDVNQDGHADLIVSARSDFVDVRSGKDGSRLHFITGYTSGFGRGVRAVGDLDGDKVNDLIVSHPSALPQPVRAFSGATGGYITDFGVSSTSLAWGAMDAAGDVNGDGLADVIFGQNRDPRGGAVAVFSGTPLPLVADVHELSRTTGGTQTFTLDAGSAHAGKWYLVVGSLSGIRPGIVVAPNVTVPLNRDEYLGLTILYPNVWIQNSLGRLDASGKATASLTLAANAVPAAVQGDHAYVVFGRTGGIDFASNAVPLSLP